MDYYSFCKVKSIWEYQEYGDLSEVVLASPYLPLGSLICAYHNPTMVRWWWAGFGMDAIKDKDLLPADLRAMMVIWGLAQLLKQ